MQVCPRCLGSVNRGETTCPTCGTPIIAQPGAGAKVSARASACPYCQASLEPGLRRCTSCGELLDGTSDTPPALRTTPEAGLRSVDEESTAIGMVPPELADDATPRDGVAPVQVEVDAPVALSDSDVSFAHSAELATPEAVAVPAENVLSARITLVRGSKSGTELRISKTPRTLGRSQGDVIVSDDALLAPSHATFALEESRLVVRDLGAHNGVYVQVGTAPAQLALGDFFAVGDRFFCYAGAEPPTSAPRTPEPLLGSPRGAGALHCITEILADGRAGRICRRTGPVVAIGRAGCDVTFPNDAALAPRQAELTLRADGATIRDLGGAATFVRLRANASQALAPGQLVMVGGQVLQVA